MHEMTNIHVCSHIVNVKRIYDIPGTTVHIHINTKTLTSHLKWNRDIVSRKYKANIVNFIVFYCFPTVQCTP